MSCVISVFECQTYRGRQAWAVMEGRDGNLSHARKLVMDGLRVDPYHGALWTVYSTIERQDGSDGKARKVRLVSP